MSDITQQAIMTLSASMQEAARQAANNAAFVRFYDGVIVGTAGVNKYKVAIGNVEPELPVYGNCVFNLGEHCYVVSPRNDRDFAQMFILSKGGTRPDEKAEIEQQLDQLFEDLETKIDKADLTQEEGDDETKVMSQAAVTTLFRSMSGMSALQGVVLGEKLLAKDEANYVHVPVASSSAVGVVRSSVSENQIKVLEQGVMEVNSLDLMRVEQHDDDKIILDGGHANH